jgi:hypothetical protein
MRILRCQVWHDEAMLIPWAALMLGAVAPLQATISVTPTHWVSRKDKVELVITLSNQSDQPVTVLTGNTATDNFFFDLRLVDDKGKVVWSGEEPRFVNSDDLPMGVFHTIEPHGSYRAALGWKLYNVAPGNYKLSAVYRVDPEREPNASRLYAGEIKEHHAFVGRVDSLPIDVTITAK